jgi:hypothetical protein
MSSQQALRALPEDPQLLRDCAHRMSEVIATMLMHSMNRDIRSFPSEAALAATEMETAEEHVTLTEISKHLEAARKLLTELQQQNKAPKSWQVSSADEWTGTGTFVRQPHPRRESLYHAALLRCQGVSFLIREAETDISKDAEFEGFFRAFREQVEVCANKAAQEQDNPESSPSASTS